MVTRPWLLAEQTWPSMPPRAVVMVPVGSTEQHGPHLPLDTDTTIAVAVTHRAAELLGRPGLLVAPAIGFGASGEHQSFPGTSSIGTEALTLLLIELVRSMRTWAAVVVFVNGHGGNLTALRRAVTQLRVEGHRVGWLPCATGNADLHAGLTETSLMLYLRPGSVRLDLAVAGNPTDAAGLLPLLRAGGVAAASPNAVLGDPAGAVPRRGAALLAEMATRVASGVLELIGPDEPPAQRASGTDDD